MPKSDLTRLITVLAAALAWATPGLAQAPKLRSEIERDLVAAEASFRNAPDQPGLRRAYADLLFKVGNVWQAGDALAPLATPSSSHQGDLRLGGRIALLTGEYPRAESLYQRLRAVASDDSSKRAAVDGLTLVYYQTNRYDRAATLDQPGSERSSTGGPRGTGELLDFMQKFPGRPYRIEWSGDHKVAHIPMINDFRAPGALPTFAIEVNGHPVNFILDTGGDRLYLDEGLATTLGITVVSHRTSRYAYTQGKTVEEPLGVADRVKLGEVTLRNVPVIVAKWKALGQKTDGVITTQMLKPFLATVDYQNARITLRKRTDAARVELFDWLGPGRIEVPFFLTGTHLMFAKGSLNGRQGLNLLLDSGLAFSMPLVIVNETVDLLGLPKTPVQGTRFFWVPIASHGIGDLTYGATQALGNVMVEENPYWQWGFLFDALVSHQYLKQLGSWTIDFDAMKYYFPAAARPSGG